MSRRPAPAGRGAAALTASAESAVPLPRIPVARAAKSWRVPRALAFGVFLSLCAALWETIPAMASWILSGALQWQPLSGSGQLYHGQTVSHLLVGGGVHDGPLAFALRTALAMLLLGIAGFVCSYRASASVRPLTARDNGAC